jgi:class 3 adenylate cyclase
VVDVGRNEAALRRARRRRAVRLAVAVLFVLGVTGAILGAGFSLRQEGRQAALQLADQVLDGAQARVAEDVSAFLDPAARALGIAAQLLGGQALADREDLAIRFSAATFRQLPQISLFSFADRDGNYMMVRREDGGSVFIRRIQASGGPRRVWARRMGPEGTIVELGEEQSDFDPRTRPWFQGAPERGVGWTGVYVFFTEQVPGITASIRATEAGDVFGADITLAELSRRLATLRLGQSGRAYIVDTQGRLIAGPDPAQVLMPGGTETRRVDQTGDAALIRAWDESRINGAGRRSVTIGGVTHVLWSTPLSGSATGWRLLIMVPEAEFTGTVVRGARGSLVLLGGIVLLSLILAGLLLRQGLMADRALRRAEAADQAMAEQARAWHALAEGAGAERPVQGISAAVAAATGAQRVTVWRADAALRRLVAEDMTEAGSRGHVGGHELHRAAAPRAFAALAAGRRLSDDERTELASAMPDTDPGDAPTILPLQHQDRMVGLLIIDQPRDEPTGLIEAAGGLLARLLAPLPEPAQVTALPLAPAPGEMMPQREADLRLPDLPPDQLAADVYTDVAVLVMRFGDASTLAARAEDRPVADTVARLLQQAASRHAIPYLKLMGTEATAAAGFGAADPGAPGRLAAMATDLRGRLNALAEDLERSLDLRLGLDVGLAIGGAIGGDPAVFNLWGEAVRNAAAMAATAPPNGVQTTEAARARIGSAFLFRPRGAFWVPRAGEMRTFLLTGPA